MVKMSLVYQGELRCSITHGPSGSVISTDAPADNQGKGEAFSPTDLLCTSLASCIITTMAIFGSRHNVKLDGTRADIVKEMVTEPVRRVGKISITFHMAPGIDPGMRATLEKVGHACPVHRSLHPDVAQDLRFVYPD